MEILVFKGKKAILVKRNSTESKDFFKTFTKRYNKLRVAKSNSLKRDGGDKVLPQLGILPG